MALHSIAAAVAAVAIRNREMAAAAQASPFVGASSDNAEMSPAPINPAWILSGAPQARYASHSEATDKFAATGVWDCTAGTFRWYFGWDETVVILDGEVHITAEDGSERMLGVGDVGYFRGGTWATWHVDTYVRKIAFVRKPLPMSLSLMLRAWGKLMRKTSAGLAA